MHPFRTLIKTLLALLFALLLGAAALLAISIRAGHVPAPESAATTTDFSPELAKVGAKAFYVYDMSDGKVLFAKNEHESLPLASITKLMTGLVVLNLVPSTTTVQIASEDTALGSGTGLVVGEKWDLEDLLDFSLITSSNDGIHAIARTADAVSGEDVIALMNEKAKELGLADTLFMNETGLDIDVPGGVSGAYSSAADVSALILDILKEKPEVIRATHNQTETFISESDILHIASNTDLSLKNIPAVLVSKTGYTDLAGGNLAVVFDAGLDHPVISVVLGSTEDGRFADTDTLVDLALRKISEESGSLVF